MADTRTPEQRSRIMRSVGTKNTAPELVVRRVLHRMGIRFRLHRRDLPGTPDVVLPGRRIAIFVHGCFWHAHGCSKGRAPKSREEYWKPKLDQTRARDQRSVAALLEIGWKPVTVWQCEVTNEAALEAHLKALLGFEKPIDIAREEG
jgi:DNA mismatch endonuclease, patch repair protein